GDEVVGATLNSTGSFIMRAGKIGADTLLSRIVAMVANAQRSRAPIQQLADQVAAVFVPTVIVIAMITFVAWSVWGPQPALTYAMLNAVAVLIIACPCALGLATPMSVMVASGRGASLGILFKDAGSIERLQDVTTLVVDKTGTLTAGRPELVSVVPTHGDYDEEALLGFAASVEQGSEHPLAAAIVKEARERDIVIQAMRDFQSATGKGVQGIVSGSKVSIGNAAMVHASGVNPADVLEDARMLQSGGQTVMFVMINGNLAGYLGVADPIKPGSAEAVNELQKEGVQLIILTGDNKRTADVVARQLGIEEVVAEVSPEDKMAYVEKLRQSGQVVAMAGDGINDAPALASADVGIAMGTGTDVAMESAHVTLITGDLRALVTARRLSRATLRNIKQNLVFAFAYNGLGVPVAAGMFYPVFGLLLSPMFAAFAMSASSVSVIFNALRLNHIALKRNGDAQA
ncbi:MAG: heavy metal translocating P-type ATPase, partial [Gammaproteobacteria bacterium]|nr:heavy metal translocating P-type ATPase [Gammaproteobacteria bacterium]